jgi:hypothetical protein
MGTLNVLLSFAQFGDAKSGDIIVNVSNAKDLRERSLARNPSSRPPELHPTEHQRGRPGTLRILSSRIRKDIRCCSPVAARKET